MRLAPSLHRLGEAIVSCYLLEEAGEVTLIDAGVPAYYGELTAELAAITSSPSSCTSESARRTGDLDPRR